MVHHYLTGTPIRGAGQVIDVHRIAKTAETQIAREAAAAMHRMMSHEEPKMVKAEMMEAKVHPSHAGRHEQGFGGRQVHRASFLPPADLPAHVPGNRHEVPIPVIPNPMSMKHKVAPVEAHATGRPAPKTPSCYGMFYPNRTPPRGDVPLAYIG